MLLRAALLLAVLPACPWDDGDGQVTCDEVMADDPSGAPQFVVVSGGDGMLHDTVEGAQPRLYAAPQGGHILLIGARAHATDTCQVTINAALRDPRNTRVIGLEERDIVLVPRGDGWVAPKHPDQLSDLANVAVCPSSVASLPIDGNPFQLEVRLSANGNTLASATIGVTPTCETGDDYCHGDCSVP